MNSLVQPERVEEWKLGGHAGVSSKLLVNGENMTVMWTRWEPGALAPEHTHPHEQVGVVLEGEIVVIVAGEAVTVRAGEFYYIPGNAPHLERNDGAVPAVLTDFWSPIRADLLKRRFTPHDAQAPDPESTSTRGTAND